MACLLATTLRQWQLVAGEVLASVAIVNPISILYSIFNGSFPDDAAGTINRAFHHQHHNHIDKKQKRGFMQGHRWKDSLLGRIFKTIEATSADCNFEAFGNNFARPFGVDQLETMARLGKLSQQVS